MLDIFKTKIPEQIQNDAVDLIMHHLKIYNFTHTQKALAIRDIKNKIQKQVQETIDDAITANSI